MICSNCGHDSAKTHAVDPWCMYQVRDGVVVNELFLPHLIPEGWYDSPKAAKAAVKVVEPPIERVSVVTKKTDGRTKAGKKAKLDVNSSGSD